MKVSPLLRCMLAGYGLGVALHSAAADEVIVPAIQPVPQVVRPEPAVLSPVAVQAPAEKKAVVAKKQATPKKAVKKAAYKKAEPRKPRYKKAPSRKSVGRKAPERAVALGQDAIENVTLNFVDAAITSVVKAMGDLTGKTILVDPRVKGTLQITSPQPVSSGTAYEIILAALRMQGFAAVETDGVVRIVPEAEAKFYAASLPARETAPSGKSGKSGAKGEMITRVFDLKYESAQQLLQVLRPLMGANSTMNANPVSNTLVVTDYAGNIERIGQIIDTLDMQNSDEPVLVPVRHAAAQDIAALIGKLYRSAAVHGAPGAPATAGSGAEAERLDVAVDVRSNSILLRSRNRSLVSRVQNLVASLDTPTPAAGNVHVIYLKNAEATKVAETLRKILAADTSASVPVRPGTPGAAQVVDGGAPGVIQADAASNALIITAPEAVFNNIREVVDKLDVRRAQVLVEALIAEVSVSKANELGIQWFDASGGAAGVNSEKFFGGFGNSSSTTNIGAVAANPMNAARGLSVGVVKGQLTLPGNITILNLGLLARALETQADANILSTPTLMTLDNEEAKISVGANVPFTTGQYALAGNAATPFQTIERKDVGLTLKVKPQISEGGTVRLQIYQEVSKIRQQTEGVTLATTDKRAIESTVLVDDGQIVVLGGLIEDQLQDVEDRVPLLGDVPVLGHLFRYNTQVRAKTNLMVFLRPQVVRDDRAAESVTRSRYDYIRGEQQAAAAVSGDRLTGAREMPAIGLPAFAAEAPPPPSLPALAPPAPPR